MRVFAAAAGASGGLQHAVDRRAGAPPRVRGVLQPLPAARGEAVVLGAAIVLGHVPCRRQQPAQLQPVQGRVQGSLFDGQRLRGRHVNPVGDLVAVLLAGGEGPQNQQLQRALEEVRRLVRVRSHNHLRVPSLP